MHNNKCLKLDDLDFPVAGEKWRKVARGSINYTWKRLNVTTCFVGPVIGI